MFRQDGAIPTISKNRIPERLIIFDTESHKGQLVDGKEMQYLRLGVAQFLRLDKTGQVIEDDIYNFHTGLDLAQYIEFQTRKDKRLYVYAHNLKYDLQLSGILTDLIESGWKLVTFVMDDPPTFIHLKKGRKAIMLVDTFNYWQYSLSKMGDQLGYNKLKMPAWEASDREWFIYCKKDVLVLSRYLTEFIQYLIRENLAPLGLTLASQAFRSYRARFLKRDIEIHNNKEVLDLEREGYTGGRVEAYYLGKLTGEKFYKLDVNSMYPYVMDKHPFPIKLIAHAAEISAAQLKKLLSQYYVIARVYIETDRPAFAVRKDGKLLFPVGRFIATLHKPELEYALEHAKIERIELVSIYEFDYIFRDYIQFFYQAKQKAGQENNMIERQKAKLFLNSLYGKFGQRGLVAKTVDNPDGFTFGRMKGYSQSLGRSVEVVTLGDKMEIRYREGEAPYSFPAIAGSVTAFARMYLWELIESAGVENTFYLDTDSIFVNQDGFLNVAHLLDDDRLGALKVEDISTDVQIFGLKDYHFGDVVKHKGIPKSAHKIDIDLWEYDSFLGAKTWINNGMQKGVVITKQQKRRLHTYTKGLLTISGRVIPLTLVEW